MGPFLPILIFLFWQSPISIERLAFESGFPGAPLSYVSYQPQVGEPASEIREYSRAVVRVLQAGMQPEVPPSGVESQSEVPELVDPLPTVGFASSHRSRDGPRA